jgi:hypothetical protein
MVQGGSYTPPKWSPLGFGTVYSGTILLRGGTTASQ